MIGLLAEKPLPGLLAALFVAVFEIGRWRKVPNMIAPQGTTPMYILLAQATFFVVVLFSFASIFWFEGALIAFCTLAFCWLTAFVIGGMIIPLILKGDSWIQFTAGCIAVWPLAFFTCRNIYGFYWVLR